MLWQLLLISTFFSNVTAWIEGLVASHGYIAVFLLMTLESAGLPIPSEAVLPLTGLFVARGTFGAIPAYGVALLGSIVGSLSAYYIAFVIGKDVVYNHAEKFHIKKTKLSAIDDWFAKEGPLTVFIAKMLPIVRGLINLPAGFAQMNVVKFAIFSTIGSALWNALLIGFGFYAFSSTSISSIMIWIGLLLFVLYILYEFAKRKMKRKQQNLAY